MALHLPEPSGPSRALGPVLRGLAREASVTVAVPGPGIAADELAHVGRVSRSGTGALRPPRRPGRCCRRAQAARRRRRFRGLLRAEEADLAIVSTTTLPRSCSRPGWRHVPMIVYATELFRQGAAASLRAPVGAGRCGSTRASPPSPSRARGRWPTSCPRARAAPSCTRPSAAAGRRRRRGVPGALRRAGGGSVPGHPGNVSRGRGQDVAIRSWPTCGATTRARGWSSPTFPTRARRTAVRGGAEGAGVGPRGRRRVHFCGLGAARRRVRGVRRRREPRAVRRDVRDHRDGGARGRAPVVSTDVGAVPEVLEDGSTRCSSRRPPDAMAAAVRRLDAARAGRPARR